MKRLAIAAALLLSGAAVAQTTTDTDVNLNPDGSVTTTTTTENEVTGATTTTQSTTDHITTMTTVAPASGHVVQPGNANPERDARGITALSDPPIVPAGWNGLAGTAMGGPLVDPGTGEAVDADDDSYPACSATVTDNCIQAYEVGSD